MLEHWAQGLEFGCKVEECICECIFHYIALFCLPCSINILTSLTSTGILCCNGHGLCDRGSNPPQSAYS
jgi:hypothetical protein